MNVTYPRKEYYTKLFPKGYLGTNELSMNLYPSYVKDIPGYSRDAALSFFQKEVNELKSGESRTVLTNMLLSFKEATSKPAVVPIPVINTTPIQLVNKTGVVIPFEVTNAPNNLIESKISGLLALKLDAPPVRYPGSKKNELPPASIYIPTHPSSEIVPKPDVKPTIKIQEQILAFTPEQISIDTLSNIDIEKINSSHGKNSYNTAKLKEIAKGMGLTLKAPIRKPEIVKIILETIAKNYGISTEGTEFQLITNIKAKIDSLKQTRRI